MDAAKETSPATRYLAAIIAGEKILHAWPCASQEEALGRLRRWYAVRRAIDRLECGESAEARAAYEVEPARATLEDISRWWADTCQGYFVTISEADDQDPLEAALEEHRKTGEEDRAVIEQEIRAELNKLTSSA